MYSLRWCYGFKNGSVVCGGWSHEKPLSFGAGAVAKLPGVDRAWAEMKMDGHDESIPFSVPVEDFKRFLWEFHSTGNDDASIIGLVMETNHGRYRVRTDGVTVQEFL